MEADSLGMQDSEQTRAWSPDELPDAGDSANGRAGPQKVRKTKRVRPQLQGEGAVSTTLSSPSEPSVAKRKKEVYTSLC